VQPYEYRAAPPLAHVHRRGIADHRGGGGGEQDSGGRCSSGCGHVQPLAPAWASP
jgi:hypothetical protein